MMNVTPRARDHLLALRRDAAPSHPDMALRLVAGSPGSLGLLPGVRVPGDRVVAHRGVLFLLLDPVLASALDRATLDVSDGPGGHGLVVRPPRRRRALVGGGRPAQSSAVSMLRPAPAQAGVRP